MQVDAILLRRVHVWDRKTPRGRPAKGWGALHAQRLRGARLADLASQVAYQAALEAERRASEPCDGLAEGVREAASSSALASAVDAVRWLKGVGFACTLAFCAEATAPAQQRTAGQAAQSPRSRVNLGRGLAQGTRSARTPCSGHLTRRTRYSRWHRRRPAPIALQSLGERAVS